MRRLSDTPYRSVALCAFAMVSVATSGLAQQDIASRLDRAASLFEALHVEAARDSLQALLQTDTSWPDTTLQDAHTLLGTVHHALGELDSARTHFGAVVQGDVFASLDPDRYNPALVALFREARRSTPAIGLAVEPPLTVDPMSDSLRVHVAIGMPGSAEISLHPGAAADAPAASRTTTRLVADSIVRLAVRVAGDTAIEPGQYTLRAAYAARSGDTLRAVLTLDVTRLTVDTLPLAPPPDSSAFRPETQKGGPPLSSLLTGVAVGAASAALPMVLWNSDLGSAEMRTGAIAVGGSVAIAGVVGMIVGRPDEPIPANIDYNDRILEEWRGNNQRIAADNEQRRRTAPLTIRVVREP